MISSGNVCEKVNAAAFSVLCVVGAAVGRFPVVSLALDTVDGRPVEIERVVVIVAEERFSVDVAEDTPLDPIVLCSAVDFDSASEVDDSMVKEGVGFASAQDTKVATNADAKNTTTTALFFNLLHTFLIPISTMHI